MFQQYHFNITEIPDCTHFKFTRLHEGNIGQHIFERSEQLLRMISRFRPGSIACQIKACYNPKAEYLQGRLKWSLTLYCEEDISQETVDSLITNGPLAPFYEFKETDVSEVSYTAFGAVCEIIRYEEALRPLVPKDRNPNINFKFYYSVKPFKPNPGNDFMLLDRTLSGFSDEIDIEIFATPAEVVNVRKIHFAWVSHLMSVNAYDDDTFIPGREEDLSQSEGFFTDASLPPSSSERKKRAKDPIADEFLRENQELFQNLRQEQLKFSIKVYAPRQETSLAVAATLAESCFSEGHYQILGYDSNSPWFTSSVKESESGILLEDPYNETMFGGEPPSNTKILRQMTRMATAGEIKGLFRLPVAGAFSPRCMKKSTDPDAIPSNESVLIGHDLEMGIDPPRLDSQDLGNVLKEAGQQVPQARLPLNLFKKHLFIAGVPGSGKTTAVFNLLTQLYRQGVPFLVIEPAKTEYRVLKTLTDHQNPAVRKLAENLRVYTAGNEDISPFRINPFTYPEGIGRDEHISQLMSCFKAGMPLFGPLENVILDSMEEVYREVPEGREVPVMEDLFRVAGSIMRGKGYEGEVQSNLTASIEVRLGGLTRRSIGKIFSSENSSPSIDELLRYPTIIETEHMSNETACLLILFVLSAVREHIKVTRDSGSALKHVIVLEEAHNVVGSTGPVQSGEDSVDPRAFAAQYISRMLAELRALGESILIADQLPSAVAPEVIKNTGTKIAGRLVSKDDRESLGATMLLSPMQMEEIARLKVGETYIYHEDLHAPRRVKALDAHTYLNLEGRHPGGREIVTYLKGDEWFQHGLVVQLSKLSQLIEVFKQTLDAADDTLNTASDWIKDKKKRKEPDFEETKEYLEMTITSLRSSIEREYKILYSENCQPVSNRVGNCGNKKAEEIMDEIDGYMVSTVNPGVEEFLDIADELLEKLHSD
jgi:hypothetical protein